MKKDALYYSTTSSGTQCHLCPHECKIINGHYGACGTRTCEKNRLLTLAYANPVATHADPIEKKPLYHFKPGHLTYSIATAGCNLHCLNCQNEHISQVSPHNKNTPMMPEDVITACKKKKCSSISLTYTDPVVYYEYALDIAKLAKQYHIPVILVSAGYINPKPLSALIPYLTAANIDLKAMSDSFYVQNCKASLAPVLTTIRTLHTSKVWLELTNLLIPQLNDQDEHLQNLCKWMAENNMEHVPIHFSRFFPHHHLSNLKPTSIASIENALCVAKSFNLQYAYPGNITLNSAAKTLCPSCQTTLIKRHGYQIEIATSFYGRCIQCGTNIPGIW